MPATEFGRWRLTRSRCKTGSLCRRVLRRNRRLELFEINFSFNLTGRVTNYLSTLIHLEIAKRSEAKRASKINKYDVKLRIVFLAPLRSAISRRIKWTNNWSLFPQGLNFCIQKNFHNSPARAMTADLSIIFEEISMTATVIQPQLVQSPDGIFTMHFCPFHVKMLSGQNQAHQKICWVHLIFSTKF